MQRAGSLKPSAGPSDRVARMRIVENITRRKKVSRHRCSESLQKLSCLLFLKFFSLSLHFEVPQMTDDESLDTSIDIVMAAWIGSINMAWAVVEAQVTAALYSLLSIDEIELSIIVGRLEVMPKLKKIHDILTHRTDQISKTRLAYVESLLSEIDAIRPIRNAVTHGTYQGKTTKGEYFFLLTADILFDKEQGTAYKSRVFTRKTLQKHLDEVAAIMTAIPKNFDSVKMRELHSAPSRVPKHLTVDPDP
jgi:hypothetical protein